MIDNEQMEKERELLKKTGNVTFYYDRKERLDRMPDHKKLYNGELSKRKGFFSTLTGTKQNRFLIGTIIFFMAAVMIMTRLTEPTDEVVFDNFTAKMSAFAHDKTVYVRILFDQVGNFTEKQNIEISLGAYAESGVLTDSKLLLSSFEGEEVHINTSFEDKDIEEVAAILNISGIEKKISVSVDRE